MSFVAGNDVPHVLNFTSERLQFSNENILGEPTSLGNCFDIRGIAKISLKVNGSTASIEPRWESISLHNNKRKESARKDACSILCLLFAFQDCFCSSSQIILAVISIEKTASEIARQARTFLLMKCVLFLFSLLSHWNVV